MSGIPKKLKTFSMKKNSKQTTNNNMNNNNNMTPSKSLEYYENKYGKIVLPPCDPNDPNDKPVKLDADFYSIVYAYKENQIQEEA
jgi:hypothetical protein